MPSGWARTESTVVTSTKTWLLYRQLEVVRRRTHYLRRVRDTDNWRATPVGRAFKLTGSRLPCAMGCRTSLASLRSLTGRDRIFTILFSLSATFKVLAWTCLATLTPIAGPTAHAIDTFAEARTVVCVIISCVRFPPLFPFAPRRISFDATVIASVRSLLAIMFTTLILAIPAQVGNVVKTAAFKTVDTREELGGHIFRGPARESTAENENGKVDGGGER